jgi:hypothetical protein
VDQYEVIFVDDCSTDGVYDLLVQACAAASNWRVIRLEENSGSPSEPRNRGVAEARGDYVFFLDSDDEILPDTLRVHLNHAKTTGADVVRGSLIVEERGSRRLMNHLDGWTDSLDRSARISLMIRLQSTTVCSLIRAEVLRRNGIRWRNDLRMGEDTLFLAATLAASKTVEYIDHPTFIYVKTFGATPSSTQSYGDRELRDHLTVWREATGLLSTVGVDYISLRLQVGLQAAIRAMIFFNRGDISDETLAALSDFLCARWETISAFNFAPRVKELVLHLIGRDYGAFRADCRPRLLIAGFDLKFLDGLIPALSRRFDVRIDLWTGHNAHDEAASRAALKWAELIWCEWLLGNAVWYAKHKTSQQRMIVRLHRFELGRDFGDSINMQNVDAVVAVSTLFLERVLERFPHLPREKARLLHNYIDTRAYRRCDNPDRRFRLGMVGILPARKGLASALSVLGKLRE